MTRGLRGSRHRLLGGSLLLQKCICVSKQKKEKAKAGAVMISILEPSPPSCTTTPVRGSYGANNWGVPDATGKKKERSKRRETKNSLESTRVGVSPTMPLSVLQVVVWARRAICCLTKAQPSEKAVAIFDLKFQK